MSLFLVLLMRIERDFLFGFCVVCGMATDVLLLYLEDKSKSGLLKLLCLTMRHKNLSLFPHFAKCAAKMYTIIVEKRL